MPANNRIAASNDRSSVRRAATKCFRWMAALLPVPSVRRVIADSGEMSISIDASQFAVSLPSGRGSKQTRLASFSRTVFVGKCIAHPSQMA